MLGNILFRDGLEGSFLSRLWIIPLTHPLGSRGKENAERSILFPGRKRQVLNNHQHFPCAVWMMEACWQFTALIHICYKLSYIFTFPNLVSRFIVNTTLRVCINLLFRGKQLYQESCSKFKCPSLKAKADSEYEKKSYNRHTSFCWRMRISPIYVIFHIFVSLNSMLL
jgi:hypothetical protein